MSKCALCVAGIGPLFAFGPMLVTAEDLPDPLAAGWNGEHEVELRVDYSWTSDGVSWHEVLNVGETTSVYLIVESY